VIDILEHINAVRRHVSRTTEDELSAATEASLAQFAPGVPSSEG
jgi:hypothetical protein